MASEKEQEIPVEDLKLDLLNPRGTGYPDQVTAIEAIVKRAPAKLVALAEDIATQGMNPADRMIVIKDLDDSRYIVLEGNRRLAAIKLLCDPTRISKMPMSSALAKRLRIVAEKFDHTIVDPLACVVMDSREEADHWIDLRHTGENDGAGIVPWDGMDTARFRGSDPALQVLAYVRGHKNLDSNTRELLERFPITNLGRILGDPDCREALGISIEKGKVSSLAGDTAMFKALKRLVIDLGSGAKTVTDIKRKQDRKNYIKSIKSELPDPKAATAPWPLEQGQATAQANTGKSKRAKPLSTHRKRMIPKSCVLQINEPKINAIYLELRGKINVHEAPNAAAVMSRVFFELCVDHYLATFKITPPNDRLRTKATSVRDDMKAKGVQKDVLTPLNHALSKQGAQFAIDLLHMYVHNRHFAPIPSDLITSWDNMQPFFEALWELIE